MVFIASERASVARRTVNPSQMPFERSDRDLVERVKTGDLKSFEALHRRYYPRIYRFAYLRTGNAEDAADIAADVFCRALQHLGRYEFRHTNSLYPWLHQIAYNCVVDLARSRPPGGMVSLDAQTATEVNSFLELLADASPTPHDMAERKEVQDIICEVIAQLPADQAKAVAYRFMGDLSIKEIAAELERSEGAVKSLLHRALVELRQRLREATAQAGVARTASGTHTDERPTIQINRRHGA